MYVFSYDVLHVGSALVCACPCVSRSFTITARHVVLALISTQHTFVPEHEESVLPSVYPENERTVLLFALCADNIVSVDARSIVVCVGGILH